MNSKNKRVVVTGLGLICSSGIGKESVWKNLVEGRSNISRISSFDPANFVSQIGAEVKDFDPKDFMDRKEAKRMDRFTQFAVAATKMAVEDAGLVITDEMSERAGVLVGSGVGGINIFEQQCHNYLKKGPSHISPILIPMLITNMASGYISIIFNARGPNYTISTACATGAHCIGESYNIIKRGAADIMIAGASEASITPLIIAGFGNMKVLSRRNDEPQKGSRPFDKQRDGFVIGEGAGILILESLESALKREADIYGEIAGYGMTSDAFHITSLDPDCSGPVRAMKLALEDGAVEPGNIDYINAHGSSTILNDLIETKAIKKLFGHYAYKIPVSSIKSMTGHTMGAAGALEFASTLLTVKENIITPTINLECPDPDCDLDYVPCKARYKEVNIAMSNSFGFGGTCAILIAKKIDC